MNFNGSLNNNLILGIKNMIIGQYAPIHYASAESKFLNKGRKSAGMYGDKALFYDTDSIVFKAFTQDGNDEVNVLMLHRQAAPNCQEITINKAFQGALTTDGLFSKQAFLDGASFKSIMGTLHTWLSLGKELKTSTEYNVFLGCAKGYDGAGTPAEQKHEVDLRSASSGQPLYGLTGNEADRKKTMLISRDIFNLKHFLSKVPSRKYNKYNNIHSYDKVDIIFNQKYASEMIQVGLPTIFNSEKLLDPDNIMPSQYFGDDFDLTGTLTNTGWAKSGTTYTYTAANDTSSKVYRIKWEIDLNSVAPSNNAYNKALHLYAGDQIVDGTAITEAQMAAFGATAADLLYTENDKVICKILVEYPPVMDAYESKTEFNNPKNHSKNDYVTFVRNTFAVMDRSPYITVYAKES